MSRDSANSASASLRRGMGQRRIMLIVVLVGAAFILFFPARQLVDQRQRIAGLEERLDALQTENKKLEKEVSRLTDPAELEIAARERLGLAKPDERIYYVESGRPEKTPPATVEDKRSWFDRAWDWITTLIRGRD
ncbi:MAG: septum formation initiator family protein [Actinomycetota bacterium]